MMYPFMTLEDNTEIVHSETIQQGDRETVKVYIEKPVDSGFHSATCWLPDYRWENVKGFSTAEMDYFQELVQSVSHILIRLARDGGLEHAVSF